MATWVSTISCDITDRAQRPNVTIHNERLWLYLTKSFRRQYANTQEQEQAEDILQRGIHMKGKDLDGYIMRYEALVVEAGYD